MRCAEECSRLAHLYPDFNLPGCFSADLDYDCNEPSTGLERADLSCSVDRSFILGLDLSMKERTSRLLQAVFEAPPIARAEGPFRTLFVWLRSLSTGLIPAFPHRPRAAVAPPRFWRPLPFRNRSLLPHRYFFSRPLHLITFRFLPLLLFRDVASALHCGSQNACAARLPSSAAG